MEKLVRPCVNTLRTTQITLESNIATYYNSGKAAVALAGLITHEDSEIMDMFEHSHDYLTSAGDLSDDLDWSKPTAFQGVAVPKDVPLRIPDGIARDFNTPPNEAETRRGPHWIYWKPAMESELESHRINKTYIRVGRPEGARVIGSQWVYKIKELDNGQIERFKCRLVARGDRQIPEVDFTDTFSPTLPYGMARFILVWGLQNSMDTHHLDVKTAFLIPDLP